MRYPTQKIAFTYFVGALVLFLAQMLFGVLAGTVYVSRTSCQNCCRSTSSA